MDAADIRNPSFRVGGEDGRRSTDFTEGKRFVGMQIAKLMHLRPAPKRQPFDAVPSGREPKE